MVILQQSRETSVNINSNVNNSYKPEQCCTGIAEVKGLNPVQA